MRTEQISEIISMAWDDETSFNQIYAQTGLAEGEVIALMRKTLKPRSFRLWRKRVSGRKTKHEARRPAPTPKTTVLNKPKNEH